MLCGLGLPGIKAGLLEKRLAGLANEAQRHAQKRSGLEEVRGAPPATRDELKRAVSENGGDRLERLDAEIVAADQERRRRRDRADRYEAMAAVLGLARAEDSDGFAKNLALLQEKQTDWKNEEAGLQNQRAEDEGRLSRPAEGARGSGVGTGIPPPPSVESSPGAGGLPGTALFRFEARPGLTPFCWRIDHGPSRAGGMGRGRRARVAQFRLVAAGP